MRSGTGGPWLACEGTQKQGAGTNGDRQVIKPRAVCENARKRSRRLRLCHNATAKPATIMTVIPLAARSMSDIVWRGESQKSTTGSTGPQMYQANHSRTNMRRIRRFIRMPLNSHHTTVRQPKQRGGRRVASDGFTCGASHNRLHSAPFAP